MPRVDWEAAAARIETIVAALTSRAIAFDRAVAAEAVAYCRRMAAGGREDAGAVAISRASSPSLQHCGVSHVENPCKTMAALSPATAKTRVSPCDPPRVAPVLPLKALHQGAIVQGMASRV